MASPQHALYVPRMAIQWLTEHPDQRTIEREGSVVFADISGFTALSERLMAEMGDRGAETVTRVMNKAFAELVEVVLLEHGDLLRFGGDAILVMFTGEGHLGRACRAACDMRDGIGDVETPGDPLGISIGLATGMIRVDRIGTGSQELVVSGDTIDRMLAAESDAASGEIGIDEVAVRDLPSSVVDRTNNGWRLLDDPDLTPLLDDIPEIRISEGIEPDVFISPDLRDRLTLSLQEGQHRTASIGFVKVSGLGALDDAERVESLGRLFGVVIDRCGANAVSYLGSDVDFDGVKFILAAGVPNRVRTKDGLAAALHEIVQSEPRLAVSGGSAHGAVFAGDLGAPGRRCYTVMADTVNLAARLASAAPHGEVWTTAAAMDRTAGVFDTSVLPPISLKGKSMEVAPIRLDALRAHADEETLTRNVIGREAEIASVKRLVEEGLGGQGAVVVLAGPEGMGKGTIAAAASDDGVATNTRLRCTDRWEGLHGIARRIVQLILGSSDVQTPSELTDAVMSVAPDLAPWVPLIGDVLGVDVPATTATTLLPAELYLARLHEAVISLLVAVLGDRPAMLRVEDATLADETSIGLLEMLTHAVSGHPWVVIVTCNEVPSWVPEETPTIRVDHLDEARARGFVLETLGDDTLPAPIIDEIVARAAGRPAALSELTWSARQGDGVPETIEAAALARIDRLDERDRQLLSYASVFGMDARIDLLATLLPEMSTALEDAESWDRLGGFIDTEVLGRIRFRDAIHRDVAYQILSHQRRVQVHALAGEAIERQAKRRPERFVSELSYHFHQAEDWDKSWHYNRMAASRAFDGQAPLQAIRSLQRAIEAASHLDTDETELGAVHERLGGAFERAGMFDQAIDTYERAEALQIDDEEGWRLVGLIGRALVQLGRPDEARSKLETVLGNARSIEARSEALTAIAGMEIRKGHFEEAARWCDRVFDETDAESAAVARAHYIRALASTQTGWSDATEHAKRAREIYERIGDLGGAANALNNLGYHAFYTGSWGECENHHRAALVARNETGDVIGRALASYNLGELLLEQGRLEEAESLLLEALADFRGSAHVVGEAACRITLGRLKGRSGHVDDARNHFDRAATVALSASADEQLVDVALGRCELALLQGAPSAGSNLKSVDAESLSSVQRVRFDLFAALADRNDGARQERLVRVSHAAQELGALHIVQLAGECLARLYGQDQERPVELSSRLDMRARPLFRL